MNDAHYFELILSPSETPVIATTLSELEQGGFDITGSIENEAYFAFLRESLIYEDSLKSCELRKNTVSYYDPRYLSSLKTYEDGYFNLQADHNDRLLRVRNRYPSTFTAQELIPVMLFPSPTAEDRLRFETNRAFLHQHYFDNYTDLSAAALDHYLLFRKMDVYFSEYSESGSDKGGIIQKLYEKTRHDHVLSGHVFNHLLTRLLSDNDDPGVEYAYLTWQGDGCQEPPPNSRISDEFIERTLEHAVGKKVSELQLKDETGQLRSLYGQLANDRLTILVFWQNQCHTCEKELPLIMDLVRNFEKFDLGAFSVCVDNVETVAGNSATAPSEKWVSVNDDQRVAIEQFAIWQTPAIYILDHTGLILAKHLFGKDLENFIHSYVPSE